jgi:hypothetical protein
MPRTAVVLAFGSLALAMPATTSDAATDKALTIRVYVEEVTQSVKDVPPKTLILRRVYTKGDTISGTETLWNAARQFDKPIGAKVGSDRYVITGVKDNWVRADFVTRLPGGSVHAHGEGEPGVNAEVPVVGGTGVYAGATGVAVGRHLANGKKLNTYRLQLP